MDKTQFIADRIAQALQLPEATQFGTPETVGRDIQHLVIITDKRGKTNAYRSFHAGLISLGYASLEEKSIGWILALRAEAKAGAQSLLMPNGDVIGVRLIRSTQASRRLLRPIFA